MKKALLIHGLLKEKEFYGPKYPTASNMHWFPWLSKQLMICDIHTVAIEMPRPFYPDYEVWKKELDRFELDDETILVGHSCGGGFLTRYVSENQIRIKKLVLVAPWIGIGVNGKNHIDKTFFKFDINRDLVYRTIDGVTLFESTSDYDDIKKSVEILKKNVNDLKVITLENRGHFTNPNKTAGYMEFPELLEEVIRGSGD